MGDIVATSTNAMGSKVKTIKQLNRVLQNLEPDLCIHKGEGYFYFSTEADRNPPESIYVYAINQMSRDQWISALKSSVADWHESHH